MPLDVFGGGAALPSDLSFRSLVISTDTTLQWPNLSESVTDTVARLMDVTANAANLSITLPDARQVAVGQDVLFRNLGGESFTVKSNGGSAIGIVGVGEAKYFYLTSASAAAGSWGVIQFGVGSSNADASSLAGAGLKAIQTTLNQKHDVVEVSQDISILDSDRAKTYVWTSGTHTLTLPTSVSVGPDFFFIAKNGGSGTVTAVRSGGDTIDGAVSLNLAPNDGVIFYSGGSSNKWYTVAQGRPVTFAFTQLVKNVGGSNDIVLTSSEAANKVITFTGALTANINVIVPNTVSVYYLFNDTSGSFSLTVKTQTGSGLSVTQGTREIGVCDGANVRRGVDNTAATTLFSVGSESAPSVTFVTDPDTGFFRPEADAAAVAAGGAEAMRWTRVASAINSWDVRPSATGQPLLMQPIGDDANISVLHKAKGTGQVLFDDDEWHVRDDGDVSKKMRFECSSITTGTTRTLTVPDASGTVVLTAATQTLTNKTINGAVFTGAEPTDAGTITCPVGVILPFAGTAAPSGWIMCFGQAISRTTFARLFAVIGTTYGAGDGSTTFNLPDMRGRVVAGKDDMGGTSANRLTSPINGDVLGAAGGAESHQLTTAQTPVKSHTHGVNDPGHTHNAKSQSYQISIDNVAGNVLRTDFGEVGGLLGTSGTGISIQSTSDSTASAHPNVQPTIIMNYIIKG